MYAYVYVWRFQKSDPWLGHFVGFWTPLLVAWQKRDPACQAVDLVCHYSYMEAPGLSCGRYRILIGYMVYKFGIDYKVYGV